jgi:hypothetical protein
MGRKFVMHPRKPHLDGLVIPPPTPRTHPPTHKPNLDGLTLDLSSLHVHKSHRHDYRQVLHVKRRGPEYASKPKVATPAPAPAKPRPIKPIKPAAPASHKHMPTPEEIEAAKAGFRERHSSEMLKPLNDWKREKQEPD